MSDDNQTLNIALPSKIQQSQTYQLNSIIHMQIYAHDDNTFSIKNNNIVPFYINNQLLKPKNKVTLNLNRYYGKRKLYIKLKIFKSLTYKTYIINILPSDFPKFKVSGKSKYKGEIYTTAKCEGKETNCFYLLKFDKNGSITFYKKVNEFAVQFDKVISKKGKIRYTYKTADKGFEAIDKCRSQFVILDENYNEIDRVSYMLNGRKQGIDRHDAIYIDDGHYILSTMTAKKNNTSYHHEIKKINASLVQEIVNGKVKWEFDSSDYDYLLKYYNEDFGILPINYNVNYMHFNSFTIDPKDNNLLVSFRELNAIIKINRKNGKIIWILGGEGDEFGLFKEQKFIHQHSISIEKDGAILMYDNGEEFIRNYSRIVEIKIDEKKKKKLKYKDYYLGDICSQSYGYVQVIDKKKGVYLLNYGMGGIADKQDIEEVNLKTGKVEFSINFPHQVITDVYKG